MAISWTLSDGTNTKTLAEWGIKNLQIYYRSMSVDVMSFDIPMLFDGTSPFDFDDVITLYRDATKHFVGRVAKAPRIAAAKNELIRFEVHGPWQYLEQLVFQQTWTVWDAIAETEVSVNKSRIIFGVDNEGAPVSTGLMLVDIINYAISAGSNIDAGTFLTGYNIPDFEAVDITCAEAVRSVLKWHPSAVCYFDYSTTTPTLHIVEKADLSAVTISSNITSISLQSRDEIVPSGVIINFEQLIDVSGTTKEYVTQQKYPVSVTESTPRTLVFSVDRRGINGQLTGTVTDLAYNYFQQLATIEYDGNIILVSEDIDTTVTLGRKVNVSGYLSAWATMNATIQSISENINSGQKSITIGLNPLLAFSDFISLLTINRSRHVGDSQRYSSASPDNTQQIPITGSESAFPAGWSEQQIYINGSTGVLTKTVLFKD